MYWSGTSTELIFGTDAACLVEWVFYASFLGYQVIGSFSIAFYRLLTLKLTNFTYAVIGHKKMAALVMLFSWVLCGSMVYWAFSAATSKKYIAVVEYCR